MMKSGTDILEAFKLLGPLLVVLIALLWPRAAAGPLIRFEHLLARIARHKRLTVFIIGALTFMGSAAVSLLVEIPVPAVPDEFGYLLAADTFASGRVTNPTHPKWVHFESYHIIHQPTYAAKYPPVQGLMLALGQLLGHPIIGVWLSAALMCASICWMLQAWTRPRWALLGSLLAMLHLGVASYWSQSYWGGAATAVGGALLYGALRRLFDRVSAGNALVLALGLAILANSRPFEGLLASIPAMIMLLVKIAGRERPPLRDTFTKIVMPASAVLIACGALICYYNWRVTGNALLMPYQLHENLYNPIPVVILQQPRFDLSYQHKVIFDFYKEGLDWYLGYYRSLPSILMGTTIKFRVLWLFYLGTALSIPLVTIRLVLKERWMRFAVCTCLFVLAAMVIETYTHSHYIAPITALIFAVITVALRRLSQFRWQGRDTGRTIALLLPLFYLALVVLRAGLGLVNTDPLPWRYYRAQLEARLEREGARHLVIMRYGEGHLHTNEWVYNRADIDNARVVWAREIDPAQNCDLINYFKDRKAWLVIVDNDEDFPRIVEYRGCN